MLKFDLRDAWAKMKTALQRSKRYVDSVSITMPFGTINLKPNEIESETAKEIVIFLSDRRVLDASECCDSCVSAALQSIQEIRAFLVQKELILKGHTDSVLYLLIEMMLTAIRQFQTHCERLQLPSRTVGLEQNGDSYYEALNALRGTLLALLSQIANIARIPLGQKVLLGNYSSIEVSEKGDYLVRWQSDQYLLETRDRD